MPADRNSSAKSRSATASIELSNVAVNPSRAAVSATGSGIVEPARAPAPRQDTSAATRARSNRSASRRSGNAWASRWWASRTGWARWACVYPGMTAPGCPAARRASAPASPRADPARSNKGLRQSHCDLRRRGCRQSRQVGVVHGARGAQEHDHHGFILRELLQRHDFVGARVG